MRTYIVHLAVHNVKGEFTYEVCCDREVTAAAAALERYPNAYLVYTSEKK